MLSKSEGFLKLSNIHKEYHLIAEVGAGTYGCVYKAWNYRGKKYYALKKIETAKAKQEPEGFPITAIREIKLLRMLKHENIIALKEIIMSKPNQYNLKQGSTFLVFEYMEHDFYGLLKKSIEFKMPQVKCIMLQLLQGILYLHQSKVIHRDIKSGNILLNNKGEVKIADLGLSRQMSPAVDPSYTTKVVTLWYRAPELLFGLSKYSEQIDVWSVGCIMAELLTREILFKGEGEAKQLELILDLCGDPDEARWPELMKQEVYKEIMSARKTGYRPRKLKRHFLETRKITDEFALDLLDRLLILNPKERITVAEALRHPFFAHEPLPCSKAEMPKYDKEYHESYLEKEEKILEKQKKVVHSVSDGILRPSTYNRKYGQRGTNNSSNSTNRGGFGANFPHENNASSNRYVGMMPFDKASFVNGASVAKDPKLQIKEEPGKEMAYRKAEPTSGSGAHPMLSLSLNAVPNPPNNYAGQSNGSHSKPAAAEAQNNEPQTESGLLLLINSNSKSGSRAVGENGESLLRFTGSLKPEVPVKAVTKSREEEKKPAPAVNQNLVFLSKIGSSSSNLSGGVNGVHGNGSNISNVSNSGVIGNASNVSSNSASSKGASNANYSNPTDKKVQNPHEQLKRKKQLQQSQSGDPQKLTGSSRKTPMKTTPHSSAQKNKISEFSETAASSPKLRKKIKLSPDEENHY